jgi:hypothetical protein
VGGFRLHWLRLTVGRKPPLNFDDVDRLPMRVRWTDLDQLRHVKQRRLPVDDGPRPGRPDEARFLKRTGGTVTVDELNALAGMDLALIPVEDWVRRWADDVALPSTRAEAPSEWA